MAVSFVAILIVACGMALLAKRLRLPYTVVLVVAAPNEAVGRAFALRGVDPCTLVS